MEIDFKPYFEKYEELSKMVDDVFVKVKEQYPELVKCEEGCADCCHALFDLTLIEALYINHKFNEKFDGLEKLKLLDAANSADRKIHKIKKRAYKEFKKDGNQVRVLGKMAMEKVRCPFLNDDNSCMMYEYRPLTCRLYGVPTASNGISHICGKTGFKQGDKYPTVNMDILHKKMYDISEAFVKDIKSRHLKMAEVIVPLSMAVLTEYTDEYLGISDSDKKDENKGSEDGRV